MGIPDIFVDHHSVLSRGQLTHFPYQIADAIGPEIQKEDIHFRLDRDTVRSAKLVRDKKLHRNRGRQFLGPMR